jgi:hypothetical protein
MHRARQFNDAACSLTVQLEFNRAIMRETASITFFTICNEAYFPGLVGLINSLRLVGHDSPIVVGDCGLTPEQRAVLADHCTPV